MSTYRTVGPLALGLSWLFTAGGGALSAAEESPRIVERGPHNRMWERATVHTLPDGRSITNRSSFMELETGLHYQNAQGDWIESKAEIELFQDGAIARQGPHQALFSPNLNSAGAIDLLTPDGRRLRSHVIGLGVFDSATGNSELLAEIKDSLGELHPPNVVLYRDAFDGAAADVRYTYQKGGFIQDVIVLERIVLPQGFDPATTRLEVWTEFLESPVPQKTAQVRGAMTDESLDFGTMQIGPGRAFSLGQGDAPAVSAPVAKRWLQIEGRTFLVEAVQYQSVKDELDQLPAPQQQAAAGRPAKALQIPRLDANRRPFPPPRQAQAKNPSAKIQMAGLSPPSRGLVLDYDLSGTLTNYTFKADTTYYISGQVTLRGPTFEGGTVIKYANTNSAKLVIYEPGTYQVTWLASAYRPVVLTARDDHTVGEKIGTDTLSGYYASTGLRFGSGGALTLEHLRVSHAVVGVSADESNLTNRHSQFVHCGDAIDSHWCHVVLENVLIYDATNVFTGEMDPGGYKIIGRHVTINQATNLASYSDINVYFTNSLLVNVTITELNLQTNAVVVTTSSGLFQTVGAGAHYLSTNSPYRNAGVTNFNATLLADLRQRTTYPPIIYTNRIEANLTLSPQAQRDTDQPDLGYYYAPLDYLLAFNATTNNAVVTVTAGTSIGWGYTGALWLQDGSSLVSMGTPVQRNQVSRFNAVQEIGTNWGGTASFSQTIYSYHVGSDPAAAVRLRFTDFNGLSGQTYDLFADDSTFKINPLIVEHCTFNAVPLYYFGNSATPVCTLFNNLFERVAFSFEGDATLNVHNNFFRAPSAASIIKYGDSTWILRDNLFSDTAITDGSEDTPITHDHNGYLNVSDRLSPNQASDVVLTNLAFQVGPLGRFYQPTNSALTNAGSRYASVASLYHFCVTTNQVKETNSTVDIGFHYVAVNSSGQPIDTDGDGLPDYFEDIDGDGAIDSGETNPSDPADWGLRVFITRPRPGASIP